MFWLSLSISCRSRILDFTTSHFFIFKKLRIQKYGIHWTIFNTHILLQFVDLYLSLHLILTFVAGSGNSTSLGWLLCALTVGSVLLSECPKGSICDIFPTVLSDLWQLCCSSLPINTQVKLYLIQGE